MSMTVNAYGQFIPFSTSKEYEKYPKSDWCDLDWIAYTVLKMSEKDAYEIKTSLSDVSEMVYAAIDDYGYKDVFNGIGGNGWSSDATVEDKIFCIIGELGGLREFDYNC